MARWTYSYIFCYLKLLWGSSASHDPTFPAWIPYWLSLNKPIISDESLHDCIQIKFKIPIIYTSFVEHVQVRIFHSQLPECPLRGLCRPSSADHIQNLQIHGNSVHRGAQERSRRERRVSGNNFAVSHSILEHEVALKQIINLQLIIIHLILFTVATVERRPDWIRTRPAVSASTLQSGWGIWRGKRMRRLSMSAGKCCAGGNIHWGYRQ